jgi:2-C-methyl-D-erythritol 4-phosphate cytidylyltransferase
VSADAGLTALVLAGTRPGGDPLAQRNGVSHKALLDVGGSSMLARVVAALNAVPQVARIVIATDRAELLDHLPPAEKPVSVIKAGAGPSASVALALLCRVLTSERSPPTSASVEAAPFCRLTMLPSAALT